MINQLISKYLFPVIVFCLLVSCKNEPVTTPSEDVNKTSPPIQVPVFSKDSAYAFIAKQVSFGPRVPGSEGHKKTRQWLVSKLKSYGAAVTEQSFKAETATIDEVRGVNIIASFNPTYARRVMLAAHWDTRFAADEDDTRATEPLDGADDGGSGVGVLLEIARLIKEHPISLGIDIVFFDIEDQGDTNAGNETWCLGSQYWGKNPHAKGYRAEYGILLDMVGAKGAVFQKEDVSDTFPLEKSKRIHQLYDKVWTLARGMNKSAQFVDVKGNPIIDDHFFVNYYQDFPMIDIIHKPINSPRGFGPHWHTHDDNLSVIDPNILGTVGQVVLAYVYNSSKAPI